MGLDRFGSLLVFLTLAFLLSGLGENEWSSVVGACANIAALIAGFRSTGMRNDGRKTLIFLFVGLLGLGLIVVFGSTTIVGGIGALMQVVVLAAIFGALVRRVLQHERVTAATIMGVISAYVLIGLIFAWIYLALIGFRPGQILDPPAANVPVYYSFVVLSTLGFGDITPVDEIAQRVTALEAVTGQIFLATVVARFVAMFGAIRSHEKGGPVE